MKLKYKLLSLLEVKIRGPTQLKLVIMTPGREHNSIHLLEVVAIQELFLRI